MYRDLVGKPEQIEAGGKVWWLQTFCRWDGTVKAVTLYNGDGDLIGEFKSREDAIRAAESSAASQISRCNAAD